MIPGDPTDPYYKLKQHAASLAAASLAANDLADRSVAIPTQGAVPGLMSAAMPQAATQMAPISGAQPAQPPVIVPTTGVSNPELNPAAASAAAPSAYPPGFVHKDTFNYEWYMTKVLGYDPQKVWALEAARKSGLPVNDPKLASIMAANAAATNAANAQAAAAQ